MSSVEYTPLITFAALLLSAPALALIAFPSLGASVERPSWEIGNPYAQVDWESDEYHKANLHTHTTRSDGGMAPHTVVDKYHTDQRCHMPPRGFWKKGRLRLRNWSMKTATRQKWK